MDIEGFKTIQERPATDEIRSGLSEYGGDVLTTKFPSFVDGLKASTRRIVYVSKEYQEAKGLNKMIGDIGDYHTAGDSSIYGAIIRLGQAFMVGNPIIQIYGKSGEYASPNSAAAPRYLKAELSNFAKDVYFNGINLATLPMQSTKDFKTKEPINLVPKIPMALILGNLTIGFAFKSHIPMISLDNVCNLVSEFASFYKKNDTDFYQVPPMPSVSKYFTPAFPIDNLIKNREQLAKEYARDNFSTPIDYEGSCLMTGDSITLYAVPYNVNFGEVTTKLRDKMSEKKSYLLDYLVTAKQYSTDQAEFYIELKRGQNPFEIFEMIKPILKFSDSMHPHHHYVRDNKVVELSPFLVTYYWYKERYKNIAAGLRYRQRDLSSAIYQQEAMLVVCDYMDEVISIIRESDYDDAPANLRKRFTDLTMNQALVIVGQALRTLSRTTRATITAKLEELKTKLDNVRVAFTKIHETISTEAQLIKKKYGKPTPTTYADEFVGRVAFGNLGSIQFFNEDDMCNILNTKWPSSIKRTIHIYNPKSSKYILRGRKLYPLLDNSRHIYCEDLLCYQDESADCTLVINSNGSTCVIEKDVREIKPGVKLFPISERFYAIHKNGDITYETVKNFSIRKSIGSGAKSDLIYGLPSKCKDMIVIHMNDSNPNVLCFNRILMSKDALGKVTAVPKGHTYILGIYSIKTNEIYLNIPEECLSKLHIEYLKISNVSALFTSKNLQMIDLGKSTGIARKVKKCKACKSMRTLDLSEE